MASGAPSHDPIVILNAYAQVLVVSMAEVMVCWAVVAGAVPGSLENRAWVAVLSAAVIASVLFGVYHFAHSAPFNAPGIVAFLSIIGLVTSAVFFLTGDLYATIAFHNALGTLGIVRCCGAVYVPLREGLQPARGLVGRRPGHQHGGAPPTIGSF